MIEKQVLTAKEKAWNIIRKNPGWYCNHPKDFRAEAVKRYPKTELVTLDRMRRKIREENHIPKTVDVAERESSWRRTMTQSNLQEFEKSKKVKEMVQIPKEDVQGKGTYMKAKDLGDGFRGKFQVREYCGAKEYDDGRKHQILGNLLDPAGQLLQEDLTWTLNYTSLQRISNAYGLDTDAWIGKQIKLYTTIQPINGKDTLVLYAREDQTEVKAEVVNPGINPA